MIAKLSILPCRHVREQVAQAFRLRENLAGWMNTGYNFTIAMSPATLRICMDHDAERAVCRYFSHCDSCWYDYSSFQNPVSFLLHGTQSRPHKYVCASMVSLMASHSVEVAHHLAKYISVGNLQDAEKLLDFGLGELRRPADSRNPCLIPALAIAERIYRDARWESVLKRFMHGRSEELLETVMLLGSMRKDKKKKKKNKNKKNKGDDDDDDVNDDYDDIRSVSNVLDAVESTLPPFDSNLAAHALRYWNPGTVAMVLNKISKSDLERYVAYAADSDEEDVTDMMMLIVVAVYLMTESITVTHCAIRLRLNAGIMFARCRLDCYEEPPSGDCWHDVVDENYSYFLEQLRIRWPKVLL